MKEAGAQGPFMLVCLLIYLLARPSHLWALQHNKSAHFFVGLEALLLDLAKFVLAVMSKCASVVALK